MASSDFDAKFDAALAKRVAALSDLGVKVPGFIRRNVLAIANATALNAKKLTPRYEPHPADRKPKKSTGGHIADCWTADGVSLGTDISVRVYNTNPRANAKIKMKSGGTTTILHTLEYGSAAGAKIVPVRAPKLVFFWKKRVGGPGVVEMDQVTRGGTKPYAMLGLSRVKANIAMKKTLDAVRVVFRAAVAGKKVVVPPAPSGGAS